MYMCVSICVYVSECMCIHVGEYVYAPGFLSSKKTMEELDISLLFFSFRARD